MHHCAIVNLLRLRIVNVLLSSIFSTAGPFEFLLQRLGLRAKNARAENPLVNNGTQRNEETTCVLGRVLQTQRFNNAFASETGRIRYRRVRFQMWNGVRHSLISAKELTYGCAWVGHP